jgi:hypothetical protein
VAFWCPWVFITQQFLGTLKRGKICWEIDLTCFGDFQCFHRVVSSSFNELTHHQSFVCHIYTSVTTSGRIESGSASLVVFKGSQNKILHLGPICVNNRYSQGNPHFLPQHQQEITSEDCYIRCLVVLMVARGTEGWVWLDCLWFSVCVFIGWAIYRIGI